jgi:TPR repeat protein
MAGLTVLIGVALAAGPALSENLFVQMLGTKELYQRGMYMVEHGRNREAIEAFELALSKRSDPAYQVNTMRALAELYMKSGRAADIARAGQYLETAALANDGGAVGDLIRLQSDGKYQPRNLRALLPLYEQRARDSSNAAALLLAKLTEEGALGRRPASSALGWYQIAAQRGSSDAARALVLAYARGGQDDQAVAWIKRLGSDRAASTYLDLAKSFLSGTDGVKQNAGRAMGWYRRALAADPEKAGRSAARFYALASDSEKGQILKVVREAAEKGDPTAAFFVAKLLDQNEPGKVNPEAMRLYLIAAKAGNQEASARLASALGFVDEKDPLRAEMLGAVKESAASGNVAAMMTLANLYGVGGLVSRDLGESFNWYLKAAHAGNSEAEFRTGVAYAEGLGVKTDTGEAKRWLKLASAHGFPLAQSALASIND